MTLRRDQFAGRRTDGDPRELETRSEPFHTNWLWHDLTALDGQQVSVCFSCVIRAADAPADQQMLIESLMSQRDSVSFSDVVELFDRPLREFAAALAAGETARAALDDSAAWKEKLTAEANRVAFRSGLLVLAPFDVRISSPSLDRQRRSEAVVQREAEQSSLKIARVRRTGELLTELQSLREKHPNVAAGALLGRLSESDRAEALAALLIEQGHKPATAWAVAGDSLAIVKITVGEAGWQTDEPKAVQIDATAGPMRSVSLANVAGREVLLLGAQAGVIVADRDDPARARRYGVDRTESPLGFSHAIVDGSRLIARHGAVGLVVWNLEDDGPGRVLMSEADLSGGRTGASGIGQLALLRPGCCLASSGSKISILDEPGSRLSDADGSAVESNSAIVALIAGDGCVFVVRADGSIERVDGQTARRQRIALPGAAVTAAAGLAVGDTLRLLLAGEGGVVRCIGLEDGLVTEYRSGHAGLKMLAASQSVMVGVSGDRQRLIVWSAADGRAPIAETHLASTLRHRVAGIALS